MVQVQNLLIRGLLLLTLVAMATVSGSEQEATKVTAEPASTKEATGRRVTFTCKTTLNATSLQWQDVNNHVISTNTSQRVHVTPDATLTLSDLTVNDTGVYTCMTSDGTHNATAQLVVYVMPDYFLEGMIILIINAALIVIFFGCLLHAFIKSRRRKSKQDKAEQKQAL